MKWLARWLFMRTHRDELRRLARMARGKEAPPGLPDSPATRDVFAASRRVGMLDALEVLRLFA